MHFLRRLIPSLSEDAAEAAEEAVLAKVNPQMSRRQAIAGMLAAAGNPSALIPDRKIFVPVEGLVTPNHVFSPLDLFKEKIVIATTDVRKQAHAITGLFSSTIPVEKLEQLIDRQRQRRSRLDFLREQMGGFSREQLEAYVPSTELLMRVGESGSSEGDTRRRLLSIADTFRFPEEASFEADLIFRTAQNTLQPSVNSPVPGNVKVSARDLDLALSRLGRLSATDPTKAQKLAKIRNELSSDRPPEETLDRDGGEKEGPVEILPPSGQTVKPMPERE